MSLKSVALTLKFIQRGLRERETVNEDSSLFKTVLHQNFLHEFGIIRSYVILLLYPCLEESFLLVRKFGFGPGSSFCLISKNIWKN